MRITYDSDIDMAYIYLVEVPDGGVSESEALVVRLRTGTRLVNLDFDHSGHLVGIEVDGARETLPAELLANAPPTEPPRE